MNLIADIGNTNTKIAVFQQDELIFDTRIAFNDLQEINRVISLYSDIKQAIVCSVSHEAKPIIEYIKNQQVPVVEFNAQTPVPIKIEYGTRNTLGLDRIAALVGAGNIWPNTNVLVVDFGTAITIDLLTDNGTFKGGNISPGLNTRFKALNHYTQRLPLLKPVNENVLMGTDTQQAIICGVQNGIDFEIKSYIEILEKQFSQIKVIFSGGDADFFARRLKNGIFVDSKLVLRGLNRILEYNAQSNTK
jgi:type III pantothenate kinase